MLYLLADFFRLNTYLNYPIIRPITLVLFFSIFFSSSTSTSSLFIYFSFLFHLLQFPANTYEHITRSTIAQPRLVNASTSQYPEEKSLLVAAIVGTLITMDLRTTVAISSSLVFVGGTGGRTCHGCLILLIGFLSLMSLEWYFGK